MRFRDVLPVMEEPEAYSWNMTGQATVGGVRIGDQYPAGMLQGYRKLRYVYSVEEIIRSDQTIPCLHTCLPFVI